MRRSPLRVSHAERARSVFAAFDGAGYWDSLALPGGMDGGGAQKELIRFLAREFRHHARNAAAAARRRARRR